MLPLPPPCFETVTLKNGERRNEARVQPLHALLDHLEDTAGRARLGQLLTRGETAVIRTLDSPYPLVVHAGRAYAWHPAGWQVIRMRIRPQQVVTTYPLTPSHLTLSLLRDGLERRAGGSPRPDLFRCLAQYAFLCPLTLLGVPEDLAAQVEAASTPQDEVASRTLRPPDQR